MRRVWGLRRWRGLNRHRRYTEKLISSCMGHNKNGDFRLACVEFKILVGTSLRRNVGRHWTFGRGSWAGFQD